MTTVAFTVVGTTSWTPPSGVTSVDVLVVGGGGGGGVGNLGGTALGGGGGAGGVRWVTGVAVTPGTPVSITVGSGGAGTSVESGPIAAINGGDSVFGSVIAVGGGAGGSTTNLLRNGAAGGSGGGGAGSASTPGSGGAGTAGQGKAGGAGNGATGGGNGGGAGAVGTDGGGVGGGIGVDMSMNVGSGFGASGWFGGGGGGSKPAGSTGGTGGGGSGGVSNGGIGSNGLANTGGGGGGGGSSTGVGGSGGSGIVVVTYSTTPATPTRLYLPASGSPPVSTAFGSMWEVTSDAVRHTLSTSPRDTGVILAKGSIPLSGTPKDCLLGQFISNPLAEGTISGTFSAVIACMETGGLAVEEAYLQASVSVVSGDGTTLRGVLYNGRTYTVPSSSNTAENYEFHSTQYRTRTFSAVALTSVMAQAGDRLVVELGYRSATSGTGGTANALLVFDDRASSPDLPLAVDALGGPTNSVRPWVEFSQNLSFDEEVPAPRILLQDDFNRANNVASLGSPVVGGPYTVRVGSWGISANQAYTSTFTSNAHVTFPAELNLDISVTLAVLSNNGLVFRWVDANNFWFFRSNGSSYQLGRRISGSNNIMLTFPSIAVNGDRIRVITWNLLITIIVNDRVLAELEDGWAGSATSIAGLVMESSMTNRFDDLLVNSVETPYDKPNSLGESSSGDLHYELTETDLILTPSLYKGRDTSAADESEIP